MINKFLVSLATLYLIELLIVHCMKWLKNSYNDEQKDKKDADELESDIRH